MSYHTYQDIGRYTVFTDAQMKRMFPSKLFGRYHEDEYSRNQTFGIQTREDGLRLTNDMARLTLPHERSVNYVAIASMANADVKQEILQDEKSYVAIYQDFSLSILDYIKE